MIREFENRLALIDFLKDRQWKRHTALFNANYSPAMYAQSWGHERAYQRLSKVLVKERAAVAQNEGESGRGGPRGPLRFMCHDPARPATVAPDAYKPSAFALARQKANAPEAKAERQQARSMTHDTGNER